ncbi:FadR/GntR family transcriptional regulator [Inquilinus sp. NPDC058860]|uniref:FadR/GntR family transcriptional regulator n=1 Tax=Inquilinus sp. NPDC058860 TaxID=3346652 RepID=UPI00368CBF6D
MKEIKPLARPPLLHVSVQESLKSYIDDNALSPGAPLPPENDLAQQLGVSRNSVREAIKALESLGILETRRGIGVFVKAFSFEPLLANLAYGLGGALREVEEVLEIRRVLEVGLIGKTIELIGEADLAELKDTVERMRRRAERNESFAEEDQQFHNLLFRCQNNRMLTSLIDVFWMAFYKASDFVNLANADPMSTWRDHQEIWAAIEARDGAAARSRLDQHYDGIARLLATRKGAKAEN